MAAVLILAADAARIDREQDSQHRVMSRPVLICLIAALFYVTCAQCAFVKKPGELIFYCVCVCVCVCLCVCACVAGHRRRYILLGEGSLVAALASSHRVLYKRLYSW